MKKEKALVIENAVSVVPKNDVSIEAVIQNAIDKGVPVETMERLMAMRREINAERAKSAYDRSMAAFQAECPIIKKSKPGGATRGGTVAYYYAPLESIVAQVKDLLQRHGFSYGFDTETTDKMVKAICIPKHELGHSERTSFEVPLGGKTGIMSDTQVTAAAITYAKRYAFCNAFGILTGDEDTDSAPQEEKRMEPYQVARVVPASDDEAQGHRGRGYEYPKMDETNNAKAIKDLEKKEPAKNTIIIKELLSELKKPAINAKEAIMYITMLTGGLGKGLKWIPSVNDAEVIEALRKLNLERMENERRVKDFDSTVD